MRTFGGAVGEDQCRLTATTCATAALGIVGGSRRRIAHVDGVKVGNINAQFHGRRTKQNGEFGGAEAFFTVFAISGIDLSGVLAGFE